MNVKGCVGVKYKEKEIWKVKEKVKKIFKIDGWKWGLKLKKKEEIFEEEAPPLKSKIRGWKVE